MLLLTNFLLSTMLTYTGLLHWSGWSRRPGPGEATNGAITRPAGHTGGDAVGDVVDLVVDWCVAAVDCDAIDFVHCEHTLVVLDFH